MSIVQPAAGIKSAADEKRERVKARRKSLDDAYEAAQCGDLPTITIKPFLGRVDMGLTDGAYYPLPQGGNEVHMRLAFAVAEALYEPLKFASGRVTSAVISYCPFDLSYAYSKSERAERDGVNLNVELEIRPNVGQGDTDTRFRRRFEDGIVNIKTSYAIEHALLLDVDLDYKAMAEKVVVEVKKSLQQWFDEYAQTLRFERDADLEAIQPLKENFFGKPEDK